jgi:hypothetical protein
MEPLAAECVRREPWNKGKPVGQKAPKQHMVYGV